MAGLPGELGAVRPRPDQQIPGINLYETLALGDGAQWNRGEFTPRLISFADGITRGRRTPESSNRSLSVLASWDRDGIRAQVVIERHVPIASITPQNDQFFKDVRVGKRPDIDSV